MTRPTTTQPTDVVIVGGSGFIGRRLTDRLRDGAAGQGPAWRRQVTSFSSHECNLLDRLQSSQQLARVNAETTLVVCAGISRLAGDSWSLFQTNLTMIRNLLESIDHVQPHGIIFLSSADVYGLPAVELPITETTLPRPNTYYGLAKLACERLFPLAGSRRCPVACLRLPGIYGATDDGRSVVGKFCRRLAAGQPIQLSGTPGESVDRDFVHVDDLCGLIEALIAAPADVTLNVATGVSTPIRLLATTVASRLEIPDGKLEELFESIPANPDRDHDLRFDTRRLHELFPAVAFRDLGTGIADYLRDMEQVR